MEPEATVLARPKDSSLIKNAAKGAKEQFTSITGQEVSISVKTDLSDNMSVSPLFNFICSDVECTFQCWWRQAAIWEWADLA